MLREPSPRALKMTDGLSGAALTVSGAAGAVVDGLAVAGNGSATGLSISGSSNVVAENCWPCSALVLSSWKR